MPPERLQAVAALVQERLKELATVLPSSPLAELAILAALNLASDYLDMQDDHQHLRTEIESKSKNLIQRLERHGSRSTAGG